MAVPAWNVFLAGSLLLVVLIVVLAKQTATLLADPEGPIADLSRQSLYLNVVVSHGLVLAGVGALLWWTGVPTDLLGVTVRPDPLQFGVLAGGLIALNEASDWLADAITSAENRLRELLTPATWFEWLLLGFLVLPLIAVTEEVLFRGVLIGGFSAATGLHPAVLVAGSAVAFGGAHTAQGWIGVVVAAALGLVLGGAFYLTGSLWLVIGVHYLLDLIEFARHARS